MEERRGFTLIELLVVIAIIAILAAILFPVFARARENARKINCTSNLKQMGMGWLQYAQDYDEKFPGGRGTVNTWYSYNGWPYHIQPYIKNKQIFFCPSSPGNRPANFLEPGVTNLNYPPFHYGYNWEFWSCGAWSNGNGSDTATGGRSLAAVERPSDILMVSDYGYTQTVFYISGTNWYTSTYRNFAGMLNTDSPENKRHMDGGNILFGDGHVKWMNKTTFRSKMVRQTPSTPDENSITGYTLQ